MDIDTHFQIPHLREILIGYSLQYTNMSNDLGRKVVHVVTLIHLFNCVFTTTMKNEKALYACSTMAFSTRLAFSIFVPLVLPLDFIAVIN